MRGFEVLAGVIVAFFVIGITAGVLLVVALPSFRRRRDPRYDSWPDPGYDWRGIGWEEPPGPDDDDIPPRWPGGTTA
jgi:hypothetical protein